jgi:hypothetical protein
MVDTYLAWVDAHPDPKIEWLAKHAEIKRRRAEGK